MTLNKRLIPITLAVSVLFTVFTILTLPKTSDALSGSEFNAGRIIDDVVFYNSNSMSVQQIQDFLNSKVPVCDTNGTQPYAGTTRAAYGASRGSPAPYICLKDYSQSVPTITNGGSDLCKNSITGGTKSSAQIIKDVSVACGINPQVLIVLLQKEQSLISDDWPWPIQYRSATGYGCPDTAPCDAEFYGFFNQVYQAAKAFRRYEANPNSYNYKANRNNTIYYNPNLSGCGNSNVFIQNQATASLYIYTPYQPNAAALNNLYGTGDSCSAYGNRNFWRMFNDWFGTTIGPDYHATYRSQAPYPVIDAGLNRTVYFMFENTGRVDWKDDISAVPGKDYAVHLATNWPINRGSGFVSPEWINPSRPTGKFAAVYEKDSVTLSQNQHTVKPGQVAKFEFIVTANEVIPSGVYREHFQPILEGAPGYSWNMSASAFLDIGVNRPAHTAQYNSQSPYPTITAGSVAPVFIAFKNTGKYPWFDDISSPLSKRPIHLATSWPINRASQFSNDWASVGRPGNVFTKVYNEDGVTISSNQHIVYPNQIARFDFNFTVPANTPPGEYREYFEPIVEGAPNYGWSMGSTAWLKIIVQ